jgi:nitronate monooxygenase
MRVGVGFILWALERHPAALDVALEAQPAAIMLSFGDPTPFIGRIKAAGSKIICQVQTLAQAKQAADAGADVIIAQGRDAGGHSGTTRGTIGLVPAVVDAVAPIAVVAAGGIADGRGLARAGTRCDRDIDGYAVHRLSRVAVGSGNEGRRRRCWGRPDAADPRV